jgi:uncharacterized protein YyaL (SSP411 family)
MHQPVQWNEWGAEAFERAMAEDKPVLLDIGAVWCHWCHVMDRESYENPETAALINEHFIAVKVDRDERPDVDARYQAAVAAISGQGGWPLTAFLTPEGKPFFGGTYFPPVDGHGRPSLKRVLLTMAEAFAERRAEVNESAGSVMAAIEDNESFDGSAKDPGEELVNRMVDSALQQFDSRFGGFGTQPKFPHPAALDLLIDAAGRTEDDQARAQAAKVAAMVTLEKMSKGGIYDHLAGGFHRYSVDERWVVPHFEKMSYDNSELLRTYVHAFQTFGEPECARVAQETMTWIDEWLSDRERGGFYASQDADFSLDDDGDYFTWTREEAAQVLDPAELALARIYFDLGEVGDMHHNPAKNVLHIDMTLAEAARTAAVAMGNALSTILSAKRKLYAARKLRPTPFVDKTIYVGWNAMMISAYLLAGRVLGNQAAKEFALRSLDRLLESAWDGQSMSHVVAYAEISGADAPVAGVLDDYVLTALAALDAWEICGEIRYFDAALAIAENVLANFWDQARGGFFDTVPAEASATIGALAAQRKPLQDSPTPAGNPTAATLLLRLEALTGREEFRAKALLTLECFAGVVEHLGLYAASYGLALRRFSLPPIQVVIMGDDALASELESAALMHFAVNKTVIRLRSGSALPPSLAATLGQMPRKAESSALVCTGRSCLPPIFTPEDIFAALGSNNREHPSSNARAGAGRSL